MRSCGDLPRATWVSELAGSPLLATVDAIIAAASPHGALCLCQAKRESSYGANATARANHNAWGLMVPGSNPSQLQYFATWADGAKEFSKRLSNANPPYDPHDISIKDYLLTYVGGPLCRQTQGSICANGETGASIARYTDGLLADLNRLLAASPSPAPPPPGPGPAPQPSPVFGNVPLPANFATRLVTNSTAWNDLGKRIPRGIVLHRMLGTLDGTDAYFRTTAAGTALTDFGVGAGKVYQWNDLNGRRAPWASGPADGLKGDAVVFVQKYGIDAINRDCASIEIAGQYNDPVPDADMARLVELVAWLADAWLKIPAAQWPTTNDGLEAIHFHSDFTSQKPCPGPVVKNALPLLEQMVKDRLTIFQTGHPPAPRFPNPAALDDATIQQWFPWADADGPITQWIMANRWAKGKMPDLIKSVPGRFYLLSDGTILTYANKTVTEVTG